MFVGLHNHYLYLSVHSNNVIVFGKLARVDF